MQENILIGISGASCSGKTTLTRRLKSRFEEDLVVIPLDAYYKFSEESLETRALFNHDLPEQFDWSLFNDQMTMLLNGKPIEMPVYSYRDHNRTIETIEVLSAPIIVVEGIHTFHDEKFLNSLDLKIFLDSKYEDRRDRRISRDSRERQPDMEKLISKFENQTEKTFLEFEEKYKYIADYIFDNYVVAFQFISDYIKKNAPAIG